MKRLPILLFGLLALHGAVAQTADDHEIRRSLTSAEKDYVARLTQRIQSFVAYDDKSDGADNPRVVYRILLLPTGEVMAVDCLQSSGVPAFDTAIKNAVYKASPLPKRSDGRFEHVLVIDYSLK